MTDETKLPAIAGIQQEVITDIQSIQDECSIAKLVDCANEMQKSFKVAEGIGRLSKAFGNNPQVVKNLMYLQGKKLGFRTDKDKDGGYDEVTVVNTSVEALMRGLPLTGNAFNIIGSNLYITKEGFDHLITNLDGLKNFLIDWDDYAIDKGTAKVKFKATWSYKGVEDSMTGFVPVRVNSGMIVDAIYGKAERKVSARVYKKITKSEAYFEERDASEINTTMVEQNKPSALTSGSGKITGKEAKEPGKWEG